MFLILLGMIIFFVVVNNRQQPVSTPPAVTRAPTINTFTLPGAKTGVVYKSEIIASILGSHQDINIAVTNLPEGLAMGDCKQKYDTRILPVPNTMVACPVTGTPRTAGTYQLRVSAKTPDVPLDIVADIPLLVEGQ
jgi:hypothetical protein